MEGLKIRLLFDTGADGKVLLSNMQRLGLPVEPLDAGMLSQIHRGHTGGQPRLLAASPGTTEGGLGATIEFTPACGILARRDDRIRIAWHAPRTPSCRLSIPSRQTPARMA